MIRDCTTDDIPWLLGRARDAFAPLIDGYDERGALVWIEHCVRSETMITVRGPGVAAFADVFAPPWAPMRLECDLVHLFGKSTYFNEAMSVGEFVKTRAVAMGCRTFYVGSAFADLTAVGKRFGGTPLPPVYRVELQYVQ